MPEKKMFKILYGKYKAKFANYQKRITRIATLILQY